jgi:hypothetical protein
MAGKYVETAAAAVTVTTTGLGMRASSASDWVSLATHALSRVWHAHPVLFAGVMGVLFIISLVLGTWFVRVLRTDVPLTAAAGRAH